MYLRYYLEQLSPSILNKIIEEHGLLVAGKTPNQLVEQLNGHLLNLSNIAQQYLEMTREEKETLNYFIFQMSNQILLYRKLDQFNGSLTRDQFEYGITKLRRKGILFTLRKTWGEVGYTMPENLFQVWHHFLFSNIVLNQPELNYPLDFIEEPSGFLEEDLFRLLVYIKQEEIPVTQKGTIHRRYISRVDEFINLKKEELENFPLRNTAFSKEYPKNVALLLEAALMLELITALDVVKVTKKADAWHELDHLTRREYLESIIRYMYKSTDIFFQHLYYVIFHLTKEKWFSLNRLVKDLAILLNRSVDTPFLKRAEDEIVKPLLALGWIKTARSNEELLIYRLTIENEVLNQFYIQPNYEILVPQFFPFHLRLIIEQFADLQNRDKINRYKLTKESVIRGLENGLTLEVFFNLINKHSLTPISHNVKATLMAWADSYGTISFMDVRLLKCQTPEIARDLKANEVLRDWIIGEISPTHLIIKRDSFEKLIILLKELDYRPVKGLWTGTDYIGPEESDELELIRNKDYRIENTFPSFTKRMFAD